MKAKSKTEFKSSPMLSDLTHLSFSYAQYGSTDGMFPKATDVVNGIKYYYKTSAYNKNIGVYGIHSYSEVMAGRIGQIIDVTVEMSELIYAAILLDGKRIVSYISRSEDFSDNTEKVSLETYFKTMNLSYADFVKKNRSAQSYFNKMFVFDYLINNIDRHGKNIEINRNGQLVFPLFDHGLSLLSNIDEDNVGQYHFSDSSKVNNFIGEPTLLGNVDTIKQPVALRNLSIKHFESIIFKNIPISEQRKASIQRNVMNRWNYLINNQKVSFA